MASAVRGTVLAEFHGDESFPIEWQEGEKDLFWVFDDLHCPNPLSPMFFDIGGWWLTCDHMFRRFGTPFAEHSLGADFIERATGAASGGDFKFFERGISRNKRRGARYSGRSKTCYK